MSFVHLHAPTGTPRASDFCIVIQKDRNLARSDAAEPVVLPTYADLSGWSGVSGPLMHVGRLDDTPVWLTVVEQPDAAAPAGWQWHETRSLLTLLTPSQSHAISCARQLLWWERRHRFCGACGTPMGESPDERARRCPNCSAVYFPSVSPAVIVAVTRGDEVLLAHNRNFRPGMFSILAGFVDPGETIEQAVVREVREESALEIGDVRYVKSEPWPYPNSLMLGFRARHVSGEIQVDGKEIEVAGWYQRSALPEIPRPGSLARYLIDQWLGEE